MGEFDGGLTICSRFIRGEQAGIDKPLNESLVVVIPLCKPGWSAEVPRIGHWAGGAGLGGRHGDEAEQDALQAQPIGRAEVLPQLLGSADKRPPDAWQVRPVRKFDSHALIGLQGEDAAWGVAVPQLCERDLSCRESLSQIG